MLHGKSGMNIMWQLFHYSTDIFSFTILLVMNSRSEAEVEVCDSFSNTKYIRVTIEAMTKIDHKSPLSSALLVTGQNIGHRLMPTTFQTQTLVTHEIVHAYFKGDYLKSSLALPLPFLSPWCTWVLLTHFITLCTHVLHVFMSLGFLKGGNLMTV